MKNNMYQKIDPIKNIDGIRVGWSIKQKLNLSFKFIIEDSTHAYLSMAFNQSKQS